MRCKDEKRREKNRDREMISPYASILITIGCNRFSCNSLFSWITSRITSSAACYSCHHFEEHRAAFTMSSFQLAEFLVINVSSLVKSALNMDNELLSTSFIIFESGIVESNSRVLEMNHIWFCCYSAVMPSHAINSVRKGMTPFLFRVNPDMVERNFSACSHASDIQRRQNHFASTNWTGIFYLFETRVASKIPFEFHQYPCQLQKCTNNQ